MDAFDRTVEIMRKLRSEKGCPWDRKQTHQTLKSYLIEEAYELMEAIDEQDPEKMKEELGDLLFQIVFHAQLADERGEFNIRDVLEAINQKMVARHPHVFGTDRLNTAEQVLKRWDEFKKREGKLQESLLEGVPKAMPSLLRAKKVQERASKVGFDWSEVSEVLEKVKEEFSEFIESLRHGRKDEIEEELGDLFFSLVNLSRFVSINPEDALQKTTTKFIKRFQYIEQEAKRKGKRLEDMSLEEMDALWEEAKGGKKQR
ncbi:MAG: nucleoside triphosphate pyrophosphohydrolase [Nitrospirae bacterium]|nr:MAG: nucleoside triphosphate pyrophosphohydrolase [Nitrospirota bacterium]